MAEKRIGRHDGINKKDIDPVVDDRIERAIEQLEEHIAPTFASYRGFLEEEMEWIKHETKIRKALEAPLP
ncbi:MAG: hypothetical protein NT148_00955, partial [Candidatus Nealsonbacteria bacterium]|nr:hypothetical protein [Candidatus Nealsonbacteria bacterium]